MLVSKPRNEHKDNIHNKADDTRYRLETLQDDMTSMHEQAAIFLGRQKSGSELDIRRVMFSTLRIFKTIGYFVFEFKPNMNGCTTITTFK